MQDNNECHPPVRVRIAPSPTGDPHVGTAYIALFNLAFAKSQGGKFLLRIEDTDRTRSRKDSEEAILDALKWVGLNWDEGPDIGGPYGPYRQSERLEIYQEHVESLVTSGKAYRCFCSPERLATLREVARAEKRNPKYDGHCKSIDAKTALERAQNEEPCVVRMVVPDKGTVTFTDRLRGKVEISVDQLDDQVLLKSDGFPTYHLASVVDDHLMQITHVIRAEEWISSTPKHVLLYQAFGWQEPTWVHMPLLRNRDKSKISKRKNPVSIRYYEDIGILPDALRNFLGIMGYSQGEDREVFSLEEMIDAFSWDRVSLGGPVFDQDKLRWMNEQYIHRLTDEDLVDALLAWRYSKEHLLRIAPRIHKRIKTLGDFAPATTYLFTDSVDLTPLADKLAIPNVSNKDLRKGLGELLEEYDCLEGYEPSDLEAVTRAFCEKKGWNTRPMFMLLRIATTGRKASPELFETMAVIGKEICRHRLRNVVTLLGSKK